MSSGAQTGGSQAGELARGVGKGLLLKATLVVLGSQAGLALTVAFLLGVGVLGVLGFSSTDEPDCDTAAGPTYVSSASSEEALSDIPGDYLEIYQKAADEYNIDWAILAAVGKIESDHGRLDAPGVTEGQNQHGCCAGPMQFDNNYGEGGGTWGSIAVDGNGDGEKDIYDPEDAIPSAAKYLVDGGAPDDYQSALFQYNNAQWYVDDVLAQADKYRAADGGSSEGGSGGGGEPDTGTSPALLPSLPPLISEAHARPEEGGSSEGSGEGSGDGSGDGSGGSVVSPVDEQYMDYSDDWGDDRRSGESHEGTDIFAPKGTELVSMVSGTVEENANRDEDGYSEVGGYGVLVQADEDAGPVKKGDLILYGHMQGPPSVEPGDEVEAGDPVGKVGDTGYGPPVTTGEMDPHVHVGWYTDPSDRRAESPEGAMNPFSLLQWVEESGGEASGEESEDVAPSAAPAPEECKEASGPESGKGPSGGGVQGTGSGKDVFEEATKYDGVEYVLGPPSACKPGEQMDCTCLTTTVFKEFGYTGSKELPDMPSEIPNYGKSVPVEEAQAGDIYVYADPGDYTGGHVAIADGKGGVFHCANEQLGCTYGSDYRTAGATEVTDVRRLVDGGEGGGDGGGEGGGE